VTDTPPDLSALQLRVRVAVERLAQSLVEAGVGPGDAGARGLWRGGLALAFRLLALAPLDPSPYRPPVSLLRALPDGDSVLAEALDARPALLEAFVDDVLGDTCPDVSAATLGRVYEGLIDLQPGIAVEPMVRMQRGRLEAVVPTRVGTEDREGRVVRVESIRAGSFFTHVGLGRKQSGAYYTPRDLVEFLVAGALEKPLADLVARGDSEAILDLRVLDPATGSGHFLAAACQHIAAALARVRGEGPPGRPGDLREARRRVAEECLFGVDRDGLALELSRLALWELCGEGEPPADFMAGRLVCGDSLSGPSAADLGTCPGSGSPVTGARPLMEAIRAGETGERWQGLVEAFSGGVALGRAADAGYEALVEAALADAPAGPVVDRHPQLAAMIAAGAGAVAFEVTFPEVFARSGGFDAVVGNPPWEALRPQAREFHAGLDLRVLSEAYARQRRVHRRLYRWQSARVGGRQTSGDPDLWKLFMERCAQLVRPGGDVGLLVPSAFHTNASAAGVRQLYLRHLELRACYSFENRDGLFDIHRSYKFDAVLARRDEAGTREFCCAFHLRDPSWLRSPTGFLRYTPQFLQRAGGDHRVFPELRSAVDLRVTETCFGSASSFGQVCDERGIRLSSALHMTHDADRFTPSPDQVGDGGDARDPDRAKALRRRGYLVLHEGKTFHQFDDHWGAPPRYLVHADRVADRPRWTRAARYYRLAFRAVASSTNERTCIFCVLPPGSLCGNSAPVEAHPWRRPNSEALALAAVANTHVVDFLVRVRSSANLNLFILRHTALPVLENAALQTLAIHTSLRLTCNHAGYAALWSEQLGDAWGEPAPPGTWPAVAEPSERWRLRAVLDAIVAHTFGLSRDQYEHVLGAFSHRSNPDAPDQCLGVFDDLLERGGDAFAALHDPYADVPLVSSSPSASPPESPAF